MLGEEREHSRMNSSDDVKTEDTVLVKSTKKFKGDEDVSKAQELLPVYTISKPPSFQRTKELKPVHCRTCFSSPVCCGGSDMGTKQGFESLHLDDLLLTNSECSNGETDAANQTSSITETASTCDLDYEEELQQFNADRKRRLSFEILFENPFEEPVNASDLSQPLKQRDILSPSSSMKASYNDTETYSPPSSVSMLQAAQSRKKQQDDLPKPSTTDYNGLKDSVTSSEVDSMEVQSTSSSSRQQTRLINPRKISNADVHNMVSAPYTMTNAGVRKTLTVCNVGKCSLEERRVKINRYLEKRRRRVWKKKTRYACRQELAIVRPRYKGRFIKDEAKIADIEADKQRATEAKEAALIDRRNVSKAKGTKKHSKKSAAAPALASYRNTSNVLKPSFRHNVMKKSGPHSDYLSNAVNFKAEKKEM